MKVLRGPVTDCWHRWQCTDDMDVGRLLAKGSSEWVLEIGERGEGKRSSLYFTEAETRKLFGDRLADFVRNGTTDD